MAWDRKPETHINDEDDCICISCPWIQESSEWYHKRLRPTGEKDWFIEMWNQLYDSKELFLINALSSQWYHGLFLIWTKFISFE